MDFSGMIKWGLRITASVAIIGAIIFILSAVTMPAVVANTISSGFDTVISIFYYYVPAASVLFPLITAMWALSFVILVTRFAIIGFRTLWKTSK